MSKKILFITGSPRPDSNSTQMAQWAADGAKKAGADVTVVSLNKVDCRVFGCLGCCACQNLNTYHCVQNDGIARLVESIPSYDTVVLASGVYFFSFPAQIKMVLDRFMCLCKASSNAIGKVQFVLINSAGGNADDSGIATMHEVMKFITGFVGAPAPEFFFEGGLNGNAESLMQNTDLQGKLLAFGKHLAS